MKTASVGGRDDVITASRCEGELGDEIGRFLSRMRAFERRLICQMLLQSIGQIAAQLGMPRTHLRNRTVSVQRPA